MEDKPEKNDLAFTLEILGLQKWVAERHERANEAISNRSTTILGFLGLEIAVFAVLSPKSYTHPIYIAIAGLITSLLVLSTIFCLLLVLKTKHFLWPSEDKIERALSFSVKRQIVFLKEILSQPDARNHGIFYNLRRENRQLHKPFTFAIWLTFVTQISMLVLLATMWWSGTKKS